MSEMTYFGQPYSEKATWVTDKVYIIKTF